MPEIRARPAKLDELERLVEKLVPNGLDSVPKRGLRPTDENKLEIIRVMASAVGIWLGAFCKWYNTQSAEGNIERLLSKDDVATGEQLAKNTNERFQGIFLPTKPKLKQLDIYGTYSVARQSAICHMTAAFECFRRITLDSPEARKTLGREELLAFSLLSHDLMGSTTGRPKARSGNYAVNFSEGCEAYTVIFAAVLLRHQELSGRGVFTESEFNLVHGRVNRFLNGIARVSKQISYPILYRISYLNEGLELSHQHGAIKDLKFSSRINLDDLRRLQNIPGVASDFGATQRSILTTGCPATHINSIENVNLVGLFYGVFGAYFKAAYFSNSAQRHDPERQTAQAFGGPR